MFVFQNLVKESKVTSVKEDSDNYGNKLCFISGLTLLNFEHGIVTEFKKLQAYICQDA